MSHSAALQQSLLQNLHEKNESQNLGGPKTPAPPLNDAPDNVLLLPVSPTTTTTWIKNYWKECNIDLQDWLEVFVFATWRRETLEVRFMDA